MVYSGGLEIVLITGCSEGGIGHALAKQFAATGKCLVVATSRSLGSMKDLEDDDRFYLQELDVSSDESVKKAVANVVEKYGRVDVLVNNAAVQCIGPLAEVSLADVENTFNTNVYGPMRMVQAVVPHMASRKKGKIVNVGSLVVLVPLPWLELKPLGISVTNVVPGTISTKIMKSAETSFNNRSSEWKLYKQFEPAMRRVLSMGTNVGTPAETFAKHTVDAVLAKNLPPWFTSGKHSAIAPILWLLPLRFKDLLVRSFVKP
ncbi:Short-chain dehydrogenase RED1 [Linum grandiflorum]